MHITTLFAVYHGDEVRRVPLPSQSVCFLRSTFQITVLFLFNLGAPTNSDARPCLGMGACPQKCLLCYVTHSWTLGMHVGEYGQTLRKLFVQTGGCTTVEVLNPASSFGVALPPYPPQLILGRNLHSFCFYVPSLWGPGFPILNVGG